MARKRKSFFPAGPPESGADADAQEAAVAALIAPRPQALQPLPLTRLRPNPFQSRGSFTEIEALAAEIRALGFHGVLPVRPSPDVPGAFEIVYGERRLRAARQAGLLQISCAIADYTDVEMFEIGLAENIQRADLLPLEEAAAFRYALDNRDYTIRSLAARLGKDPSYITDRLAAARAPADVQGMVEDRPDTLRAAREIAKLDDPAARAPLIAGVTDGALTTRDVRALATDLAAGTIAPAAVAQLVAERTPTREMSPLTATYLTPIPPAAPSPIVQIRLVAADEPTLRAAVATVSAALDGAAFTSTRAPGRKGDWLAYGTLRLAQEETDG